MVSGDKVQGPWFSASYHSRLGWFCSNNMPPPPAPPCADGWTAQAVCCGACARVEVLSDWKLLTKALLDDKAEEQRGDAATTNLVQLLRHAAERACSGPLSSHSDGRCVGWCVALDLPGCRLSGCRLHVQDLYVLNNSIVQMYVLRLRLLVSFRLKYVPCLAMVGELGYPWLRICIGEIKSLTDERMHCKGMGAWSEYHGSIP